MSDNVNININHGLYTTSPIRLQSDLPCLNDIAHPEVIPQVQALLHAIDNHHAEHSFAFVARFLALANYGIRGNPSVLRSLVAANFIKVIRFIITRALEVLMTRSNIGSEGILGAALEFLMHAYNDEKTCIAIIHQDKSLVGTIQQLVYLNHKNNSSHEHDWSLGIIMGYCRLKDDGMQQCAHLDCSNILVKQDFRAIRCSRCQNASFCSKACAFQACRKGHYTWCVPSFATTVILATPLEKSVPSGNLPSFPNSNVFDQMNAIEASTNRWQKTGIAIDVVNFTARMTGNSEKPFGCPFEGCLEMSARKDVIKRHAFAKHTNYRPHRCLVCPKAFLRKDEFKVHFARKICKKKK